MTVSLRQVPRAEFVRAPIGRYCSGESHLAWAASPKLSGGVVWGRPGLGEVEDMVLEHEWWRGDGHAPPVDVLLDLSALEHVSAEAFALYVRRVAPDVRAFARFIRRQALVVPAGLPGAVVAGFYPMLATLAPRHRLFADAATAARWLGPEAAARLPEVERLTAQHRATSRELHRLRAALSENAGLTVETAAGRVGVSERSLQRALADLGTSFRAEQAAARLEQAYALLRSGREKIDQIARALGLNSTAHFSAWFRALTGDTPAAWRRREVDGGGPRGSAAGSQGLSSARGKLRAEPQGRARARRRR